MSRRFDLGAALVFFIIGTAFMLGARQLSGAVYGSSISSGTFPQVFGWLLMGLSALSVFETLKKAKVEAAEAEPLFLKRFSTIAVACLGYVVLLEPLGYVISTFIFLLVSFQAMHKGDLWKSVVIAAGFSLGIVILFVYILKGSLPAWPSFI